MALKKHQVSFTLEQWDKLFITSRKRNIPISVLLREIVDDYQKPDSRKEKPSHE